MEYLERASVLLKLLAELYRSGSWCGETHLQKCTLFLQKLLHVPLGYEFIFYKYGPYSFDLNDEVSRLRGDDLLQVVPTPPYGVKIQPGNNAKLVYARFKGVSDTYREQIEFVAKKIGPKSISELERIATALWVTLENPGANRLILSTELTQLKPHVDTGEANKALAELVDIFNQAPAIQQIA